MPFLLIGCAGAIFFVVLIGGAIFALMYAGNKAADPAITAYLERVERGELAEAYAEMHPAFKEKMTEEQFQNFARGVASALGAFKSKSMRGVNINSLNSVTTTVARYAMTYEKGQATGTFTLMGGKLAGVFIQSPLIEQSLKCPYCGANLKEFGKFCPSCGKQIGALAEAEAGH